jgi:protein-tyrosine phosphatase
LNARWWTRKCAALDAVAPGIYVGRALGAKERARRGITAIVDVSAELPCSASGVDYAMVPMLDLVRPQSAQIERACRAIDKGCAAGPLLVCCALGFSRSALVVAAWLLRAQVAHTIEAAVAHVRQARPRVVFDAEHLAALNEWRETYARETLQRGCE